jgi:hypothetical protein
MKIVATRILVIGAILALTACKTTTETGGTGTPESVAAGTPKAMDAQAVGMRAEQRWKYLVNNQFAEAFDMMSPGYRQTQKQADYIETMTNRPVDWTNAAFQGELCETPDVCTVKVMVDFQIEMPSVGVVPSSDLITEKWIRVDGVWYYLPKGAGQR